MKRYLPTIIPLAVLLVLLVVLGALQFRWQTQIAVNENERMHKRLEEETNRFAEDFNREIQSAYFNFQSDSELWKKADWAEFNKRLDYWKSNTAYPDLIADLYFIAAKPGQRPLRYDPSSMTFQETDLTPEIESVSARVAKNEGPVLADVYSLSVPINNAAMVDKVILRSTLPRARSLVVRDDIPPPTNIPDTYGHLIVRLNETTIKEHILPDLVKKLFPEGDFDLSIKDRAGQAIFQTKSGLNKGDASVGFFDIKPNFIFYANRDLAPGYPDRKGVVLNTRIESRASVQTLSGNDNSNSTVKIELQKNGERMSQMVSTDEANDGAWILAARHTDGSIEAFVANTKFRSLATGFGILGLVGLAVAAVIFSAQRARAFAQRQVDFVSSVSHEFRTPLAVIYSAGENLADGVTKDDEQVSRYGNLIKAEGKKISAMVEQILEFAGARSGKRKFNFTETRIADVVDEALIECGPLIKEKGFEVQTHVSPSLPIIKADKEALNSAVQNLLVNSIKYSNGEKWLRVAAGNGGGTVKISVEDRGIGIAKSDLVRIFEPFYRAKDVVDAQIHGNGLGLALVKQIAEAHGGRVNVESEPGKGSRFIIELPQ